MAIAASLTVALGLDSARFRRGLDRSQRRTQQFSRRVNNQLTSLTRGFAAVAAAAATIGAGVSFTRAADAFTNINNLLRSAGVESANIASEFERVQNLAIGTRSDLEATGRLYATLTRLSGDLALNQEEVALATQTIQQAFAVAGTDAASAANAIRQLVQGLESGVLRGEEFNSINENANILIRLIAMNLGISVGQMRELAAEGRLTSDVVINGILRGSESVNASFQQTNATFSQISEVFEARITPALARIGNAILPAVAASLEVVAVVVENIIERVSLLNISFEQVRIVVIAIGVAAARSLGVVLVGAIFGAAAAATMLIRALFAINTALRTGAILSALNARTLLGLAINIAAVGAAYVALNNVIPEVVDEFQQQNAEIQTLTTSVPEVTDEVARLREELANLASGTGTGGQRPLQELDEGFRQVGMTIQTSLRDTFVEAFREGEISARSFFNSVTNSILQVASNALTNQLLGSIFQAAPAAGTFLGFNQGGVVPRTPGSRPGVDSVPALLTPGEIVTPAGEIPGGVTIVNNFTVDTPETFRRQAEGSAGALADIVEAQFAQRGIA